MSRARPRQPGGSTTRQPSRSPQRPFAAPSSTTRGTSRGSIRGRPMHHETNDQQTKGTTLSERTVHVGLVHCLVRSASCHTSLSSSDGYHMFTPSPMKREQIQRQAEAEQQQYEAHIERTRLRGIHEVHRLGNRTALPRAVDRMRCSQAVRR